MIVVGVVVAVVVVLDEVLVEVVEIGLLMEAVGGGPREECLSCGVDLR